MWRPVAPYDEEHPKIIAVSEFFSLKSLHARVMYIKIQDQITEEWASNLGHPGKLWLNGANGAKFLNAGVREQNHVVYFDTRESPEGPTTNVYK